MKKGQSFFKIICLIGVTFILGACSLKGEYTLEIKADKSIDVSIITALDDELITGLMSNSENSEEFSDEEKWNYLEEMLSSDSGVDYSQYEFEKSQYDDGTYRGFKFSKKIANIDSIAGKEPNLKIEDFGEISDKTIFSKDGNIYKGKIDLTNMENDIVPNVDYDMTFVIKLPTKVLKSNADKVSDDGRTLTWDLINSEVDSIEFEFKFFNYWPILIGALILVGISGGIVLFLKLKKRKKKLTPPPTVFDNTGSEVIDNRKIETKVDAFNNPIESLEDCGIVVNPNSKMENNHEVLDMESEKNEENIAISQVDLNNNQPVSVDNNLNVELNTGKFFTNNPDLVKKPEVKPEVTVADMFPTERKSEEKQKYQELDKTVLMSSLVTDVKETEKSNKFFNN